MVSLGTFSYDLTVNTSTGMSALQQFEAAAKRTRPVVEAPIKATVDTQQATQSVSALGKAAQATAAQIQKPITPQVNTKPAESQLQKFGQQFASGLGFGSGAAVAVTGIHAITDALKEAVVGGIQYNAQIETAQQTLELFTGSSVLAGQALQKLRAYADFTPFDTDEVIQSGNAFIKSVDGDVAAMERLVHLAGQLAATNPDRSAGGGFESATVALREVLGGQTESIVERFNIPRSTVQSLKDAGLEGEALAAALVKAAHGSEELVNKLSTTATGQFSNFTSAIKNLEQAATKPVFDELGKGLGEANKQLSANATEWTAYATAVGHATVFVATAIPAMFQSSQIGQILALGQALGTVAEYLQRINPQQAAELEFGGGPSNLAPRRGPAGPTSTEDPNADNIAAGQASLVHAVADSAAKIKAQATTLAKDLKELNDDTARSAIKNIDDQTKAVREGASEQKRIYDETRDAAIRSIEEQSRAFKDGIDSQVRALEVSRDRQLQAADDGHQEAIRGIEAEQKATERARTQEDRDRESAQQAILRGIDTVHEANQRGFDAEKRGVEQKRDAALRALDEESRVEATRHRDALHNIDVEKDRKLGLIDKQLDALDAAAQKDQRRQTDQSLSRSLSDANRALKEDQKALKDADTPAQRASAKRQIEQDERAIGDAKEAIRREQVRRQREDQRDALQAQKDLVNAQAQTRTATEGDIHQASDQNIQIGKQTVSDQAALDIKAIADRSKAEKDAFDQEVQDRKDAYALASQVLSDLRRDEDDAYAARKQGIDDAYDHQKEAIDKAFNDPETGSIPTLKREGDAAEREFGRQKQAANDAYAEQTKALERATEATLKDLERQKDAWTKWKEHISDQIREAGNDPKKLKDIDLSPPPGTSGTQNAGLGSGEPPSRGNIPSLANLTQEYGPTSAEIGAAIAAGVSDGLAGEEAQAQIKGATDTAIQTNVIDEAKSLLGVQSPSTVFRQIGADTVAGFQDGYQSVPLAPTIRAPFEEARDWLAPYWIGTMTDVGAGANVNFTTGYDGPGLNLALMSPFNTFFDTNAAYITDGMKNVGGSAGKALGNGFVGANPGDRIFAEVRGAAVDLTRLYPTFVQLGYNFGVSMANGFQAAVDDWHALEAGGAALGAPVGHAANGGFISGPTIVGERGPEMFVPTGAGQVIPADQTANLMASASGKGGAVGSGGASYQFGDINVSVDGAGGNAEQIAYQVAPRIIEQMARVLDAAHRDAPTRVDRILPGAD